MGAALGAWRAASADGGGVAASPPAAAVVEEEADADDGKVLELQTTIHSQQLELRQSRTAWATYSIHAVLSTAWNLRMGAAIGVWRAAAVAVAPSSSVASYAAAPEATRPALAAAEQRANQAEARAAAAEKALAHNEYESTGEDKLVAVERELQVAKAAAATASAAATAAGERHAAEMMEVETAAKRKVARAARLVQTQSLDNLQTRKGWATCSVYTHLILRRGREEASALRRWERACALMSGGGGGGGGGGGEVQAEELEETRELAKEQLAASQREVEMLVSMLEHAWAGGGREK